MSSNRLFGLLFLLLVAGTAFGQYPKVVDKVVAQVGDKIVLKSDIEFQYLQYTEQGSVPPDLRCQILDQEIAKRLLVLQAAEDSVIISDDEVELELNRRFDYFIGLLGSAEKLEEFYGKSIVRLKEEFREDIRNQLLAQRMQGVITGDVQISPAEVRTFFKEIPDDSLPYFNAEVELAHLVLIPKATQEQKDYAVEKISELRDRALAGEDFGFLASIYSEDPGSKEQNGDLGCMGRGQLVPEFERAAFSLQNGEISELVETQYGYHIIKMNERKGENACMSHILIKPPVTSSNLAIASSRLDSLKREIEEGAITFAQAVRDFSQDEQTNLTGGTVINPADGSTIFQIDALERETYFAIEQLEPGQLSTPQPYVLPAGEQAYRLLLLVNETEPHQASLEQDYSKIQAVALQEKRARLMDEWLEKRLGKTYLRIDPIFSPCEQANRWRRAAAGSVD